MHPPAHHHILCGPTFTSPSKVFSGRAQLLALSKEGTSPLWLDGVTGRGSGRRLRTCGNATGTPNLVSKGGKINGKRLIPRKCANFR